VASCSGKTALVTNASQAPGKAAAMALANEGARVLIHDQQSAANVEPIVEAIISAGGIARATAADAATADGSRQLAQEVRAVIGDRLDILVIDVDAVDPGAPFLLVELLLPILNAGSSVIAIHPRHAPDDTITSALKQRARLSRARGIRMNAVETEGLTDVSRIGAAVIFLASQDSGGMTGATIRCHPQQNAWASGGSINSAVRENRP
jgi:3-oxoacyl-[acyl-carrier protein] reductase